MFSYASTKARGFFYLFISLYFDLFNVYFKKYDIFSFWGWRHFCKIFSKNTQNNRESRFFFSENNWKVDGILLSVLLIFTKDEIEKRLTDENSYMRMRISTYTYWSGKKYDKYSPFVFLLVSLNEVHFFFLLCLDFFFSFVFLKNTGSNIKWWNVPKILISKYL